MSGVGYYPPNGKEGEKPSIESSSGGTHDWLAKLVVDWEAAAKLPDNVGTRVVSLRSGQVFNCVK